MKLNWRSHNVALKVKACEVFFFIVWSKTNLRHLKNVSIFNCCYRSDTSVNKCKAPNIIFLDFGPGQLQALCLSLVIKLNFISQPTIFKVHPPIYSIISFWFTLPNEWSMESSPLSEGLNARSLSHVCTLIYYYVKCGWSNKSAKRPLP